MKTIDNGVIFTALDNTLQGLGLRILIGGDNELGIYQDYMADDQTIVTITISNRDADHWDRQTVEEDK